jgi:hypothetical protein
MAGDSTGTAMDAAGINQGGGQGTSDSSFDASQGVREPVAFDPADKEQISAWQYIRLIVYPREKIRKGRPWIAEGRVTENTERWLILSRTATGMGKPFKSSFTIPAIYFDEGKVFVA